MDKTVICQNCLDHFSGGFAYSQHLASCNGDDRQCPLCRRWLGTRGKRDAHILLEHQEEMRKRFGKDAQAEIITPERNT